MMGLPRTFVGFSSTDIHYWRLMLAWKEHEHIDFNFSNCQLEFEVNSEDEAYIKRKCRERIELAGKFVLLIGEDTKSRHKYVRWELETAMDKGCTIIGVNTNGLREMDEQRTPPIMKNIGAMFVPFSAKIIAHALGDYVMNNSGNWRYKEEIYAKLGYST